jgi:hypothetical protein
MLASKQAIKLTSYQDDRPTGWQANKLESYQIL